MIVPRWKLSLMGIMFLNERQDCLVLNTYSINYKEFREIIEVMRTNYLFMWWVAFIEVLYNYSSGLPYAKGISGLSGPCANLSFFIDNDNLSMLFFYGIIVQGIWGYNKFSLNCVISLLPHIYFLLLLNVLCARIVNLVFCF